MIQIFLADGTDGRDGPTEGSTRGPRGPKNWKIKKNENQAPHPPECNHCGHDGELLDVGVEEVEPQLVHCQVRSGSSNPGTAVDQDCS